MSLSDIAAKLEARPTKPSVPCRTCTILEQATDTDRDLIQHYLNTRSASFVVELLTEAGHQVSTSGVRRHRREHAE